MFYKSYLFAFLKVIVLKQFGIWVILCRFPVNKVSGAHPRFPAGIKIFATEEFEPFPSVSRGLLFCWQGKKLNSCHVPIPPSLPIVCCTPWGGTEVRFLSRSRDRRHRRQCKLCTPEVTQRNSFDISRD